MNSVLVLEGDMADRHVVPCTMLQSHMTLQHTSRGGSGGNDQLPRAQDPVVEKRRLRLALRRAREEAGLTQKAVAEALDWSREKVLRIEKGAVSVHPTDVRDLLRLYNITKQGDVDHFVEMARIAMRPGWNEYKDIYAQDYITYLGFEGIASSMRQYHPTLVPGLLQTEEYAREILTKVHNNSLETVERLVDARLRRQELIEGDSGPEFRIILDEAALRRPVGSARVMKAQLRRLREIAHHDRVALALLPLSVGAHPGMRGPFILLEFADPVLDDVLFMENPRGDYVTQDDTASTAKYFSLFNELEQLSLTGPEFDTIVGEIAGESIEGQDRADPRTVPVTENETG